MKQSSKALFGILGVLLAVGLPLGVWALRPKGEATVRLANGIEVTPIDVQPDDTARALDVKVWKFDVIQPDTSKPLFLSLILYRNGKFVKTIAGGPGLGLDKNEHLRPSKQSRVMIGVAPVGSSIIDAKQLKYYLSVDGTASSDTIPNILLGGHGILTSQTQVSKDGNAMMLLSTNRTRVYLTGDATMNDTALALGISRTPPE